LALGTREGRLTIQKGISGKIFGLEVLGRERGVPSLGISLQRPKRPFCLWELSFREPAQTDLAKGEKEEGRSGKRTLTNNKDWKEGN